MKKVLFRILYLLCFLFSAGSLIAFAFYAPEKDYGRIAKCALMTFGFGMTLFGRKRRALRPNYRLYEEVYKEFVRSAFVNDKRSYRKLMEAIACYNRDEFKKGLKILEKLEEKCSNNGDYAAVYMFQALIYEETGPREKVIACYEKVLQYNMTSTTVWSNLGLCYEKMNRHAEAYENYCNAIRYDPENEVAYQNMACFYLRQEDAQKTLEYALLALRKKENYKDAIEAAAVAYKLLGNFAAVEEYRSKYVACGGDEKSFQETLALW